MDEDLESLTPSELIAEAKRLRAGIRAHRDSTGQELCWHHPKLWALLPHNTDPQPTIPDWPQFLRGCVQYRQSLDDQLPHSPRTSIELPAPDPKLVALRFNHAINTRDLDSLVPLMTPDHRFIDTEGHTIEGRDNAQNAWQSFFNAFPDYRNDFHLLTSRADTVVIVGRSHCSVPALEGPALWTAVVADHLIREWRVYPDDDPTRRSLGLRQGGSFA